jgi:hypothetical protein
MKKVKLIRLGEFLYIDQKWDPVPFRAFGAFGAPVAGFPPGAIQPKRRGRMKRPTKVIEVGKGRSVVNGKWQRVPIKHIEPRRKRR